MFEQKKLMDTFTEMVEWLMMLYRNPCQRQTEDNNDKVIISAYVHINEIVVIIESGEQKLKGERVEIENGLIDQVKEFGKQIEEVSSLVKGFKENNMVKKVEDYQRSIAEIKETL